MSETKHTPGPWRVVKRGNQMGVRGLWVDTNRDGAWKTDANQIGGFSDTDVANAALIAAAPQLLEALTSILPVLQRYGWAIAAQPDRLQCYRRVEAAIAKAEGRAE